MQRSLFLSALLVAAMSAGPAVAGMKAEPLEWKVGEDSFSGWLVYDDSGDDRRPGLVMVPNWMGVTDDALERAKAIAGAQRRVSEANGSATRVVPIASVASSTAS